MQTTVALRGLLARPYLDYCVLRFRVIFVQKDFEVAFGAVGDGLLFVVSDTIDDAAAASGFWPGGSFFLGVMVIMILYKSKKERAKEQKMHRMVFRETI